MSNKGYPLRAQLSPQTSAPFGAHIGETSAGHDSTSQKQAVSRAGWTTNVWTAHLDVALKGNQQETKQAFGLTCSWKPQMIQHSAPFSGCSNPFSRPTLLQQEAAQLVTLGEAPILAPSTSHLNMSGRLSFG